MSGDFNPHGSVTADGVLIVPGLRVFTNNLDRGTVTEDRDVTRCNCGTRHTAAQVRVGGGWFTDHQRQPLCSCRHNHWFTVTLDSGGDRMMDGERVSTRGLRGERA
jgi:hypothetical protein